MEELSEVTHEWDAFELANPAQVSFLPASFTWRTRGNSALWVCTRGSLSVSMAFRIFWEFEGSLSLVKWTDRLSELVFKSKP